jgi:hypothetical protein
MATGIVINNNEIPWSFVHSVWGRLGKDWDQTKDTFWKARNAKGGSGGIIRYIEAGFKENGNGALPYNMIPSKDVNEGRIETIRKWWDTLYQPKKKKDMASMKEIFAAFAMGEEE